MRTLLVLLFSMCISAVSAVCQTKVVVVACQPIAGTINTHSGRVVIGLPFGRRPSPTDSLDRKRGLRTRYEIPADMGPDLRIDVYDLGGRRVRNFDKYVPETGDRVLHVRDLELPASGLYPDRHHRQGEWSTRGVDRSQTMRSAYLCRPNGDRSSVGRAPDCGSGCRGFESRRSPHLRARHDHLCPAHSSSLRPKPWHMASW